MMRGWLCKLKDCAVIDKRSWGEEWCKVGVLEDRVAVELVIKGQ